MPRLTKGPLFSLRTAHESKDPACVFPSMHVRVQMARRRAFVTIWREKKKRKRRETESTACIFFDRVVPALLVVLPHVRAPLWVESRDGRLPPIVNSGALIGGFGPRKRSPTTPVFRSVTGCLAGLALLAFDLNFVFDEGNRRHSPRSPRLTRRSEFPFLPFILQLSLKLRDNDCPTARSGCAAQR